MVLLSLSYSYRSLKIDISLFEFYWYAPFDNRHCVWYFSLCHVIDASIPHRS